MVPRSGTTSALLIHHTASVCRSNKRAFDVVERERREPSRERVSRAHAVSRTGSDRGSARLRRHCRLRRGDDRMRARIDCPSIAIAESFQMPLPTVAHISPFA
jgi:hypothetical protein